MTESEKLNTKPCLWDAHTHRADAPVGEAIVHCSPADFRPRRGEWYSLGIHPWYIERELSAVGGGVSAGSDVESLFADRRPLFAHPQVLAIGEAGIDKLRGGDVERQIKLFVLQARLAEELHKPLIVHMVRSLPELLRAKHDLRPRSPWIVHGFRGSPDMALQMLSHGLLLSFGEHYRPETLRAVPIDRLFLETDESRLPIEAIYRQAAQTRGTSLEELRQAVAKNVEQVFFPYLCRS